MRPSRIAGSKVMAILLNGWILPIDEVEEGSAGRGCSTNTFVIH